MTSARKERLTTALWRRLRQFLVGNPGRWAGGSAVNSPLGLLAVERERQAACRRKERAS
jgi:hypothetical protein